MPHLASFVIVSPNEVHSRIKFILCALEKLASWKRVIPFRSTVEDALARIDLGEVTEVVFFEQEIDYTVVEACLRKGISVGRWDDDLAVIRWIVSYSIDVNGDVVYSTHTIIPHTRR